MGEYLDEKRFFIDGHGSFITGILIGKRGARIKRLQACLGVGVALGEETQSCRGGKRHVVFCSNGTVTDELRDICTLMLSPDPRLDLGPYTPQEASSVDLKVFSEKFGIKAFWEALPANEGEDDARRIRGVWEIDGLDLSRGYAYALQEAKNKANAFSEEVANIINGGCRAPSLQDQSWQRRRDAALMLATPETCQEALASLEHV